MDAIARGLATRALSEIALIDTGQPVELRTTSTHLQWRRVGDTNWTDLVPLVDTGSALDFEWDGTSLGVKRQTETEYAYVDLIGPQGVQGVKGDTGANLEFTWNGTELGVRVQGESNYQFVDLQADPIGIGDGLEADSSGTVSVDNTVVRTTRSITAGTGLTGGGDLSADRELAVDSSVVRTSRSVSTGAGLTGGGDLSEDRTLAVDNTVVRTSGDQEIGGAKKLADRTEFGAAITEHVHAVGTGSSIDLGLASIFTATLNANRAFSFTGLPAGGTGKSFVLILTHSGAGRSVTWPANVRWAGGEAPELSDASGGVDVLTFVTSDGGTTWFGFLGGVGFA